MIRAVIPSRPQTAPVADEPRVVEAVAFRATGPMSVFGGPDDTGVTPSEGLALWEPLEIASAPPGLFLDNQPKGTSGLARRLNPDANYIACRWNYHELEARHGLTRAKLRHVPVLVRALHPKPGKPEHLYCWAVDWGPNVRTRRVADLSPGAARRLGLRTDDAVSVSIIV